MNINEFWHGLLLRFPRFSDNRKYLEELGSRDHNSIRVIVDISRRYELTPYQICEALDEEGVWSPTGDLVQPRLDQVAAVISKLNSRDEAAARRLHYVPVKHETVRYSDLEVPAGIKDMLTKDEYTSLIYEAPFRDMLEKLLDNQTMSGVYSQLFDKFEVNYRLPNLVIRAMVHFMMLYQRTWSISYLDTIAADLLTKGINTFDEAMKHFDRIVSISEKKKNNRNNAKSKSIAFPKTKSPEKRINQKPRFSSEQSSNITEDEIEELIRRAKEL